MVKNNSKFPNIFILMLSILSVSMLISMFFGETVVEVLYFVGIIILVVFSILDRKYGMALTNHKLVYLLFDVVNFLAVSTILYYENSNLSLDFNLALIGLIVLNLILILLDSFVMNDKFLVNEECKIINSALICTMIGVFTFFYKPSNLWFIIVSIAFAVINLVLKLVFTFNQRKMQEEAIDNKNSDDVKKVEDIIYSNNEGEEK